MHGHLLHIVTVSQLNLLTAHKFNSISTANKHELQKVNCILKSVAIRTASSHNYAVHDICVHII